MFLIKAYYIHANFETLFAAIKFMRECKKNCTEAENEVTKYIMIGLEIIGIQK